MIISILLHLNIFVSYDTEQYVLHIHIRVSYDTEHWVLKTSFSIYMRQQYIYD